MMKVVGIGQCALDNLFIIDSFPVPDTKKEVLEWTIAGGGPVATALVALSRLGVECDFHGITGDDEAGAKIRESMLTENVNIYGLISRPGAVSQVAFIAIEKKSGKRTIFWKRPSADPLTPDELNVRARRALPLRKNIKPDSFLDGADFLHIDGLMHEASIHAVKKARAKNIPVMLDAGRMRKGMMELAHMCDYVVGSEEFARAFSVNDSNFEPEKIIKQMAKFGAKAVTITLGDKGSITLSDNEIFTTPAFTVNIVDTTGAGDVFHGGYIYGLLQNWDIMKVVRFASAFAALKCRKLGGREGIPCLDETINMLNDKHQITNKFQASKSKL